MWLFGVAGMVLVMIVLGGVTRLTGSGLSIMEWAPVSGALPPLSDAEWQRLYRLYQQIPQYPGARGLRSGRLPAHLLAGMDPPAVGPADRARVRRAADLVLGDRADRAPAASRAWLLFVLGGLQGAVGWFMVASGFPDATAVSPYRLVIHLAFALALYAAVLWTGAFGALWGSAGAPRHTGAEARRARLDRPHRADHRGRRLRGRAEGRPDLQQLPPDGRATAPRRLRGAAPVVSQPDREHRRRAVRPSPAGDAHRSRHDRHVDCRILRPASRLEHIVRWQPSWAPRLCSISWV